MNWLLNNEIIIRLSFFFGIFILVALWEVLSPKRLLSQNKIHRWLHNLGLILLNNFILRLLFPMAAVGVAVFAQQQAWGLLNFYALPATLSVLIAVVALDLIIYLQHIMVHAVPLLWRLHRVHHADLDYDVTTGLRFHPLEIVLSMLIKFSAILLLGAPVLAVIIFEIVLNGMAMFNHGNIHLPTRLDWILRWFVVTPDMHRVHHSIADDETNSNFGFNLSCWDRIFGTNQHQPRQGYQAMVFGIQQYRNPKQVNTLWGMLVLPFVGKVTAYAIHKRRWSSDQNSPE